MAKIYHDRNVKVLPDLESVRKCDLPHYKAEGHGKQEPAWRSSRIDRIWLKQTENCFGDIHDLKPTQENPTADRPEPVPKPVPEPASQSTSESYISPAVIPAPSPVVRRASPRDIERPARFADFVC